MAGASLLALLDDIATLLDDIGVMTKLAAKKTAGVLGDDLAVNAEQVSGVRLPHNAARIAAQTRVIPTGSLQPGDLVFFNTQNRPYSHMGIYLGDGKFIHAPSSKGKVRVERMNNRYFAQRFDGARSLFSDG